MAKKKNNPGDKLSNVSDYRHARTKRKNIPPAKIAAEGTVPVMPKIEYGYSPRRPPVLRFDPTGKLDDLPELLAEAKKRRLTDDEVRLLADALRAQEPWVEWAGKREAQAKGFTVDPVALHIHERVSTQAILKIAARQDVERMLFGDPEQEYQKAVQFYRHDVEWTNRLILGDSLAVMSSLARREDLAGKVQMIYLDPPYGIKFASNFQPEVGRRDVKDKEQDLTREPEMVRAYRDTWHLGIHSYLSYLRDRLIVARELLADTGSIFVQISDENVHRVRDVLEEVFGTANFCAQIGFNKSSATTSDLLPNAQDLLIWFARDIERVKFRQIYNLKQVGGAGAGEYKKLLLTDGTDRTITDEEFDDPSLIPSFASVYRVSALTSQGFRQFTTVDFDFEGGTFHPGAQSNWKTTVPGMTRLANAGRIESRAASLSYRRHFSDFPAFQITSNWADTGIAGRPGEKVYVVQTSTKVIERCMLMTTDSGDLVLDPTCGSGTTAYVAEQWGRRWITIDTSRVAIALARQRLLTAKYNYYKLRPVTPKEQTEDPNNIWLTDPEGSIKGPCTFNCKTVPHVTLKSIAQNQNLDPIFAKHKPILEANLAVCNAALKKVPKDVHDKLLEKLILKERHEGKRAVTDAGRRRWVLPPENRGSKAERDKKRKDYTVDLEFPGWYEWEVPFDTDADWPDTLKTAVIEYRAAWRDKMDEVNACIAANAEQEELVDKPDPGRGITRVSGPFTVEAVQPPEISVGDVVGEFDGAPVGLEGTFAVRPVEPRNEFEVKNVLAYLDKMTKLLKLDGVRFPNNKEMVSSRLERIGDATGIHAEGRWVPKGDSDSDTEGPATVGVVFGPQYGPVTVKMLEELIKPAGRRYDDLVVAAFNFTGEVFDLAANPEHPKLRIHPAHIRPDVNPGMAGLLKEQPGSQLFTVFGQPRVAVNGPDKRGEYVVVMEGVDVYNPVDNSIRSTGADKVAAWFLDGDYDGRTFCITQAFFPDKSAWEKLAKALNGKDGVINADRFEALSGTESLPFPVGKHRCVAVKVIDPRGNEVMQVLKIK